MSDQRKQYVLSISNLTNATTDVVGQFAYDLERIQLLGVNTPNGFVITTHAFDDFLIANDLLDYISPRINDIDYDDKNSIKQASEEIIHIIKTAIMPPLISEPILQAYSGLSGFYEAFIAIKKSAINEFLNEESYTQPVSFYNIAGKDMLLAKVKELWARLFTPEALLYRGNNGYEGYLTEAIVVQKMLQSEVSGKLFSVDQVNLDPSLIEVQAFFGLDDAHLWKDMNPDSYFVNKKSEEIVEKKIVGQDWMLVRKGKSSDKNPIIKIPISKLWQKKQKLEDKYILSLARYAKMLEEAFHKDIEAEWDYEGGKTYISSFTIHDAIQQASPENEAPSVAPAIEVVDDQAGKSSQVSGPSKSMDEYVEEIKKIREDLSTNNPLASEGKVVVDIKPYEELQLIAQGRAIGQESAFGLVHFIFADTDYADLTGDEILIIKDFDAENSTVINSVKGLIIQAEVNEEDLLALRVPVIHGVGEAFDVFQESEVITIRPWNGSIYLGAGKDTNEEEEMINTSQQHTLAENIEQPVEQPVEQTLPDEQIEQVQPRETSLISAFDSMESDQVKANALMPEPQPEIDFSSYKLPNTATDFWLAYHPGISIDGFESLDGLIVRVADIVDKYEPELFVTELNSKLVSILNHVQGKPVILVSAGRGRLLEEIVEAELDAITNLRNKDSMRNLWYSFDNISKPEDLIRLKKVFTNKGFRRSSTFKLFVTIHSPHSVIALKGLLANDIDGVILDLDLMFREHVLAASLDDEHIQEYVCEKINLINQHQALSFVMASETEIPESVAEHFVKAGLHSLALIHAEIVKIKPVVAEAESVTKIDKKKKRGRKRKEIDFGF
jgi:phosphohistidine swiveling domain-containing protein